MGGDHPVWALSAAAAAAVIAAGGRVLPNDPTATGADGFRLVPGAIVVVEAGDPAGGGLAATVARAGGALIVPGGSAADALAAGATHHAGDGGALAAGIGFAARHVARVGRGERRGGGAGAVDETMPARLLAGRDG